MTLNPQGGLTEDALVEQPAPAAVARQISDLDSRSQLMRLAEQAHEIESLDELRLD